VEAEAAIHAIDEVLDPDELVDYASTFVRIPTGVPLGFDTYVDPTDPSLVRYIGEAVGPELERVRGADVIDCRPHGLVAQLGSQGSPALLIQSYAISQHHQLMPDPYSGRVADGRVWGRGVSQSKGHQAVMLAVLHALGRLPLTLRGTLLWSINAEGRSSHRCTSAILDRLSVKPDFCVLQSPTGLRVSLGNRGRIDVSVRVEGTASHSSTPEAGASAIEGARLVMNRIRELAWQDEHPELGHRQAVIYKMAFHPVAPHTLPAVAELTIDRRLLPGDDPAAAVDEVREWLGELPPYRISVEAAEYMLPVLVDPDEPYAASLMSVASRVCEPSNVSFHAPGTFDAGGTASRGIPTVMFGARGGDWPLGADYVGIDDLVNEARTLGAFVLATLAE
jgi:acetylornithine deacetylase/succinyl-diaminopimelate desuccinylase-like protein